MAKIGVNRMPVKIIKCNFPENKIMKSNYRIYLGLGLLLPFITLAQNFNPKTVLPKSLTKYSFGMNLDEFTKKNKSATGTSETMSFRLEYQEKDADKDIKRVTYYFDAENNKPLYEMIIEFTNAEALNAHCSKKLGAPNDDKQWKWKTKEGYTFKAWRFSNTLVLAIGLPSTEWEKDWDN
jgi:hypothetical protein